MNSLYEKIIFDILIEFHVLIRIHQKIEDEFYMSQIHFISSFWFPFLCFAVFSIFANSGLIFLRKRFLYNRKKLTRFSFHLAIFFHLEWFLDKIKKILKLGNVKILKWKLETRNCEYVAVQVNCLVPRHILWSGFCQKFKWVSPIIDLLRRLRNNESTLEPKN